jgi:hypothetical protein
LRRCGTGAKIEPAMNATARLLAVLGLGLSAAACGSPDVAGVFLVMEEDGSAIVTTRSLLPQDEPGPVEGIAAGVRWTDRVRLVSSRGEVGSLADLRIDEIRFVPEGQHLRVEIPCGSKIAWVDRFAPSAEARLAAARTFDPKSDDADLGSRITFEVEVPGRIVASGAGPAIGVQTAHDRRRASLTVTVRSAREVARTVVWDVTWQ